MKDSLRAVWRWVRWPLYILVAGYVLLVIYDVQRLFDIDKTNEAVAAIHAQKITLADVQGTNLPPIPDQAENDATVEGIDKNNNGIRDDVELAIFKKYPNSAKIRAAALQYASALQMELTKVFNSETLVAVIQQEGRASICLLDTETADELEKTIINTETRIRFQKEIYEKYMTSYALPNSNFCDVNI